MRFLNTMLAALAVVAAGSAQAQEEVVLKLHQFLPAQASVPRLVLDVWADNIEADSNGRIKIERFPSMQLGGKPPDLIDQVRDGVVDIVWTLPGYTPGRFPRAEVFELPFMMSTPEATSRAFWQMAEAEMMETDFAGLHILGTWVHGPGVLHANRPVHQISDLVGMKLRAPTRVVTGVLSDLGATPIGMPVPAVSEALASGVIDGAVIPWEVAPALKLSELVHHHTEIGDEALYTATFLLAMNQEVYEGLPEDLRQVIDDNSGLEFSAFAGRVTGEADIPAREIAVEAGNEITTLSKEEVAEWKAATKAAEGRWIEEMNARGLDGAALVAKARELISANSE